MQNRRIKEEQLQTSLLNLETLSDELKRITVSAESAGDKDIQIAEILEIATKANLDNEEIEYAVHEQDVDMNKKLNGIKLEVAHFIKFVK